MLDMETASTSERSNAVPVAAEHTSNQKMLSSPSEENARFAPRPRRKRITRPEPGSLYDIMHDHMGNSLYVVPICWSDIHARLLQVRFRELDPVLYPLPGSRLCGWDACPPAKTANDISRELSTLLAYDKANRWFTKTQAVKKVMKTLFPRTLSHPKSNAELDLYFGDRVHQKVVRAPILWGRTDADSMSFESAVTQPAASSGKVSTSCKDPSSSPRTPSRPLLAYINKRQLKAIRSNLYRVCPGPVDGDQCNTPVQRLQRLRSKQLIPFDEEQDAHYVSVMLAMAQSHIYGAAGSKPRPGSTPRFGGGRVLDHVPTDFSDVKVHLMTHSDDTAEFIVYEAEMTSTFLERFAHPAKAPAEDADSGVDITFKRVPIWPILGLKERLAQALGYDIGGDIALRDWDEESNDIETWLDSEEKRNRQRIKKRMATIGVKRRRPTAEERAALSEVVNSSFEDDATSCASTRSEKDMPVLSPDAKRRCTRTANPLQVC